MNPLLNEFDLFGNYTSSMFQKTNIRHSKIFVFELGQRGFFAEITTVIRAAIFAYKHNLQLVLKNDVFGFSYRNGWSDYYLPFCQNYEPAMDQDIIEWCSAVIPGKFMREILSHHPDNLNLDYIHIHGFDNIMYFFMNMLARPNPKIVGLVQHYVKEIALPEKYNAIHIRRGDKVGWEDIYYPVDTYLDRIFESSFRDLPIFVMSDDYAAVIQVEKAIRNRQKTNRVYTICDENYAGFDVWKLRKKRDAYNEDAAIPEDTSLFQKKMYQDGCNLVVESLIASRSVSFIGTRKSNVTWAIYAMHPNKQNCIRLVPD